MLEPLALEPLKDEGIQGKSFKTFIIFISSHNVN